MYLHNIVKLKHAQHLAKGPKSIYCVLETQDFITPGLFNVLK